MISVVTVNYRTQKDTRKMLKSLFKFHSASDVEVFIIENGSGDDLRDIESTFPSVKLIESKENLGFAGGCNLGIKEARGEFVVLINPDVIFTDDALVQITEKMKSEKDIGIGGVSLKNLDGSQQACVWNFPTPLDQTLLLLKVHHIFPNIKPIASWLMKHFDYTVSNDVDQVMGAFFCIRRDVIESLGLLDDGFFMWYEEVDYCKTVKDAGWRIYFYADISALHRKGSSFETVPTIEKQKMVRRSIRRYIRKHYGFGWWLFFSINEPIFLTMSVIASVIKPL